VSIRCPFSNAGANQPARPKGISRFGARVDVAVALGHPVLHFVPTAERIARPSWGAA
jgi:hypothetical protein